MPAHWAWEQYGPGYVPSAVQSSLKSADALLALAQGGCE